MQTYILLTEKQWHDKLFAALSIRKNEKWIKIDSREGFNLVAIRQYQPRKIFIPHWSYIIPREIWSAYECIVFHMTDLPYGRGGSPLQNLIFRGINETKISALRVEEGLDTGAIYLKKALSLNGSAHDIFRRSSSIILEMIEEIITQNPTPESQTGEVYEFKRRTPEQSDIKEFEDIEKLFNQIRMLDAPGYPQAFLNLNSLKLEFFNAKLERDEILANVRITKK